MCGRVEKFVAGFIVGAVLCAALVGMAIFYAWTLVTFGPVPVFAVVCAIVGSIIGASFACSKGDDE